MNYEDMGKNIFIYQASVDIIHFSGFLVLYNYPDAHYNMYDTSYMSSCLFCCQPYWIRIRGMGLMPFSRIFRYIVTVSFIGGGTAGKPPTYNL